MGLVVADIDCGSERRISEDEREDLDCEMCVEEGEVAYYCFRPLIVALH